MKDITRPVTGYRQTAFELRDDRAGVHVPCLSSLVQSWPVGTVPRACLKPGAHSTCRLYEGQILQLASLTHEFILDFTRKAIPHSHSHQAAGMGFLSCPVPGLVALFLSSFSSL